MQGLPGLFFLFAGLVKSMSGRACDMRLTGPFRTEHTKGNGLLTTAGMFRAGEYQAFRVSGGSRERDGPLLIVREP